MKTKALISFAVTAKLICVFVFAYAKSRFSHDAAHIIMPPKDADGLANSEDRVLGLHCFPRPGCLKTYGHYGKFRWIPF